MINATELADHVKTDIFAAAAASAMSSKAVKEILSQLPIVGDGDYQFDVRNPEKGWKPGAFHWYPVGSDRGNAGRIKLGTLPENPIAERMINAMESLIELERLLELKRDASAPSPQSPREAVRRYFELPPLEEIPGLKQFIRGQKASEYARNIARRIRLRLVRSRQPVEHAVVIEDDGLGQSPERMHATLLSLGASDKGDKPYLIGVFGQGGSSAYAASEYSWLMSRRAPELREGQKDGIGWTVVKHVYAVGRRDDYWVYLAAHPDGSVPYFPASVADAVKLQQGTRIAHVGYRFAKMEPERNLYQALNHLIFNPVLPYELYTRPEPKPDVMWGNGYRLSRLSNDTKDLDKRYEPLTIEKKETE
jgi:hypothetical protein